MKLLLIPLCFLVASCFTVRPTIPVESDIGFWAFQTQLTVDSLAVELTYYDPYDKSAIAELRLSGPLKDEMFGSRRLHVSQSFIPNDTADSRYVLITLTPIVEVVGTRMTHNLPVEKSFPRPPHYFVLDTPYRITAYRPGVNKFVFRCRTHEYIITTRYLGK